MELVVGLVLVDGLGWEVWSESGVRGTVAGACGSSSSRRARSSRSACSSRESCLGGPSADVVRAGVSGACVDAGAPDSGLRDHQPIRSPQPTWLAVVCISWLAPPNTPPKRQKKGVLFLLGDGMGMDI